VKITNIYPEWATLLEGDYNQVMSCEAEYLTNLVLTRNLVVIRGFGPNLTDQQYFKFGEKFGRVWTHSQYKNPIISKGRDNTIKDIEGLFPVSYFQSHNNLFGAKYMMYHADMPHVDEFSFPGRCLYMAKNTLDKSGTTTWLNLELGWQQITQSEQQEFADLYVVYHDMYMANTRLERRPFLKINPKTQKISPSVNCWYFGKKPNGQDTLGWVNHIERNGLALSVKETGDIISRVYQLCESKLNSKYSHQWQDGDVIVYDNWFNVHSRDKVSENETVSNGVRLLKRLTFNFQ
jgi:alpha-ketoglutarate-dependent taurine dioxygenase